MSTRSAVAVVTGDTWRGRYVHSDGYPSHLLTTLLTLIQRDGRDEVVKRITEDRYGWSSLDPNQPDISGVEISPDATFGTYEYGSAEYEAWSLTKGMHADGRFANEPGYGTAYTEVAGQSAPDEWVTPEDDWGTEWVYVIGTSSIQVLEQTGSGAEVRGSVAFDAEVDTTLLRNLGCPVATRPSAEV